MDVSCLAMLLDASFVLNSIKTTSSNLQVSSTTQVMAHALLQKWGYDGFRKHCDGISQIYRNRRDIFEAALRRHMTGLAEWTSPVAGMFVWFKLRLPPTNDSPEGDSEVVIVTKALEKKVLALPGTSFFANGRKTAYVRVSFSMLGEDDTDEALRRLALVVKEAQLSP
ncbi:hypothetical protein FRC03_007120 [Tulasnella sp. 419]|nr:hypothetical protein FRC03_007120 [Tulasnella sp. 419]